MVRARRCWIALAVLAALGCCTLAAGQDTAPAGVPTVVICPIKDMVDDGMAVLVARAVREAKDAQLLVFEVDTPGGRIDSAIEITKKIMSAPCKTVAYVQGQGAISAGAIIAYACDDIVMAPATSIGASAPVMATGEDPSVTMDQKTKSFLRSRYRAMAEENGHNALLAEAMVDPNIELRGKKQPDGTYLIFEHRPEERGKKDPGLLGDTLKKVLDNGQTGEIVRQVIEEVTGVPVPELTPETPEEGEEPAVPQEDKPEIMEDGSELICARGELLTLTSGEALRYGLTPITAMSLDALLGFEHPEVKLVKHEIVPTWSEALYRWLTSPMIAGLLLLIGIGGIYIEFKTPGVWLPGVVGLAALTIFFGSHLVIGMADWLDLLLIVSGLVLLAVEIFLIPGFGLVGAAGLLCLFAGLFMSLTRVAFPEYEWDYQRLHDAVKTLSVCMISFVLLVIVSWKYLPRSPFAGWLVLRYAQSPEQGYTVQTEAQVQSAVGLRGVAASMLRPAGRGRFGNATYDVVTRGEFVEPGKPIVVVEAEGNRYVVAEVETTETQA